MIDVKEAIILNKRLNRHSFIGKVIPKVCKRQEDDLDEFELSLFGEEAAF